MNIDELKTLSQKDKRTLISLIEGMPSDINMSVKMHINDDFMNPSLSNTNIRNMHKYSTISKYLDKVNIRDIPEPTMSFYQEEYCVCIDMITKSKKINRHTVSKLVAIVNMESYNAETMINVERALSDIIEENKNDKGLPEIIELINYYIIPYKTKIYDFYAYLILNTEIEHSNYLYRMNNTIIELCENISNRYISPMDMSILIYLYYKELGIHKYINKYNLFNRFYYFIDMDESYKNDVKSFIESNSAENKSVYAISSTLLKQLEIGNILSDDISDESNRISDIDSSNVFIKDSMIFLSKDIITFDSNDINIPLQLRILNKEEICKYYSPNRKTCYIDFTLSENIYGNLINIKNMEVCSVYDELNTTIKTIGYYEGNYYLFFVDKMDRDAIHGISLNKDGNNRYIFKYNIETAYYYKYISSI